MRGEEIEIRTEAKAGEPVKDGHALQLDASAVKVNFKVDVAADAVWKSRTGLEDGSARGWRVRKREISGQRSVREQVSPKAGERTVRARGERAARAGHEGEERSVARVHETRRQRQLISGR